LGTAEGAAAGVAADVAENAAASAAPGAQRTRRIAVDGVLLLDKPVGSTSTGALTRVKRALNAIKAGHTGTLDPMASGLLPLCFGEATKFAADLLDADKSYEATLQLGATTTTGDAEGEIVEVRPVTVDTFAIKGALARFRGEIEQVPPMYSALKRDGKPLYQYARAGVILERAARRVTIFRLALVDWKELNSGQGQNTRLKISVDCSKGTYVRTLAEGIGAALGCGAHLVALRRTRVGTLDLAGAVSLDAVEAAPAGERPDFLLPVDALLASLPRILLDAALSARFVQGQRLPNQSSIDGSFSGIVRVYGSNTAGQTVLLGTGEMRANGVLAPERLVKPATVR
jgi:tRNA pseudouridine55 synthase